MKALIHNKRHSIIYGGTTIDFSLFYCDRKTMEVSVHPDCTVIVKVPLQTDRKESMYAKPLDSQTAELF